MKKSFFQKHFSGLTTNTILLAFASLFSDISTEMLYPVLPIYLTDYLRANGSIVGIIEGIAQATQNIIQGFSGWLSDRLQRRKPIAMVGYFLSAVSKPCIGLANTWRVVLAARFSDRLGAGGRAAPRDALIADSVSPENRGRAFGLEGIGDNMGAFLGPLITVLLFFSLKFDIHTIFYLAIVPGLAAFLMIFLVKEHRHSKYETPSIRYHFAQLPKAYWRFLLVTCLFGLGNSSNAFLILEIRQKGLSDVDTVIVYAFYNLIAALISYPAGSLSDKFGRKPLMLAAFIVFFVSYAGFAFSSNVFLVGFLFVAYGLFQGIFRTTGKSYATDFVPPYLRASAIGWYSTVVGVSGLIASIVAGQLWDKISHASVFIYGAAAAIIGSIFLVVLVPNSLHRAE